MRAQQFAQGLPLLLLPAEGLQPDGRFDDQLIAVGGLQHDVLMPHEVGRAAGGRFEAGQRGRVRAGRRQQPVVLHQHPQIVHHVALQFQADRADGLSATLGSTGRDRLSPQHGRGDPRVGHRGRQQEGQLVDARIANAVVQDDRFFDRAIGNADVGHRVADHLGRPRGQPQLAGVAAAGVVQGQAGGGPQLRIEPGGNPLQFGFLAVAQARGPGR